jgi:hypothetical protein
MVGVNMASPPPWAATNAAGMTAALVSSYGWCPQAAGTSGAAAHAAPAVSPTVVATRFWKTIPLPSPHPVIPPGYAITGKPSYLVTAGTLAPAAFSQATAVGSLVVVAHGSYEVDWGDGTLTGPFTAEGAPYPDGNIAHTYDNVGSYTVTVTENWTATWHLGAAQGALGGLRTQAAIPAFAVRQVQAVITG